MSIAVLDFELSHFPSEIILAEHYTKIMFLIRLYGQAVGQVELPITVETLDCKILRETLIKAVGWPIWEQWLYRDYLKLHLVSDAKNVSPKSTIAVCTRDRPKDLKRCLDSLMDLPDDGQEILVVDNCPSTDATYSLVKNYKRIRYVREDRPGLNIARNRAFQEARGDIVVFTDDDTVTDVNWLRALLCNFDDPEVLCVTGLTMPLELETKAQEWSERYSPFGRGFQRYVFDASNCHPFAAARVGAGANMALRRDLMDKVGNFDEALDAGTLTRSGGDTEMFCRILAAGYRIVYEPAALSWHRHRRTWKELREMIYGYGVGVYATWTKQLIFDGEFSILHLAWIWFHHSQFPNFINSLLRRPGCVPFDLLWAELRGCLAGPFAYIRARNRLRY